MSGEEDIDDILRAADEIQQVMSAEEEIDDILRVADEIQEDDPIISSILCEHAFSLAQNLDPNSEGREVLQVKTGSMLDIKQKLAKREGGGTDRIQDIFRLYEYRLYREKNDVDKLQEDEMKSSESGVFTGDLGELERKTVKRKKVFATLKVLGTVLEQMIKETPPKEVLEFNYVAKGYFPGYPHKQLQNECWAEAPCSVAGAKYIHEGGHLLDTRPSVQHLLDCQNCDANAEFGGFIDNAWFFMEHFGIAITCDYPRRTDITLSECFECQDLVIPKLSIDGVKTVDKNIKEIIRVLHKEGPLAVCFWCGTEDWHCYEGDITVDCGIFPGQSEDGQVAKHCAVLVGHDLRETYWILLNTGGPEWGKNGIMRLPMVKTDCFLEVTYPVRPHRIDDLLEEKKKKRKVDDDEGKKKKKKKMECLMGRGRTLACMCAPRKRKKK